MTVWDRELGVDICIEIDRYMAWIWYLPLGLEKWSNTFGPMNPRGFHYKIVRNRRLTCFLPLCAVQSHTIDWHTILQIDLIWSFQWERYHRLEHPNLTRVWSAADLDFKIDILFFSQFNEFSMRNIRIWFAEELWSTTKSRDVTTYFLSEGTFPWLWHIGQKTLIVSFVRQSSPND